MNDEDLSDARDALLRAGFSPAEAADLLIRRRVYGLPVPADHDEQRRREIALDQAARTAGGFDTGKTIRKRAEQFLRFLRDGNGRPQSVAWSPRLTSPAFVHEAIDRAWSTLREDESGLKALEGEDGDEDVLEVLRGATDEDLRRASFVAQVLRTLAQAVRADRG